MHHSLSLSLALHRIRDTQASDAFLTPIHLSNSHSSSFPRRNFCARVFASLLRQAPIEGWRSAEKRSGAAAPVGHALMRQRRA
jgi:hypothetical protein